MSTTADDSAADSISREAAAELDAAVLQLAAQATFLQAFADGLSERERPVEDLLPTRRPADDTDFCWRADSPL